MIRKKADEFGYHKVVSKCFDAIAISRGTSVKSVVPTRRITLEELESMMIIQSMQDGAIQDSAANRNRDDSLIPETGLA